MDLAEFSGGEHEAICRIRGQAEHIPLGHLPLSFKHTFCEGRIESSEGFKVHVIVA